MKLPTKLTPDRVYITEQQLWKVLKKQFGKVLGCVNPILDNMLSDQLESHIKYLTKENLECLDD